MNLRQIFKQFIAGALFVLFAVICMIGNILFIPIIVFRLNRFKAVENFARDKVASAWRFFIKMTEAFGYLEYKFDLKGEFNAKSQMIIANHPSLLDVVFLVPKFKRINCIVKGSLSKNIFYLQRSELATTYQIPKTTSFCKKASRCSKTEKIY